MGIWCDIQSHPTRPHPLPHPKLRPHIFSTFVPQSVLTDLLFLQEQLFSLFFLDSSIIALNRFLGWRMIICARISQKRRKSSPKIHTCASDFCFSTLYYCTANPPTDHSYVAACAVVCSSVQHLHVRTFCKSETPSENLGTHGSDKRKYNMQVWLWVGQWVWPVEKCSDITSITHIIFLSRDII